MDRASIIGILLGLGAVIGGNLLEGGRIDSILQPTAALIVFGGTAGATLLSVPVRDAVAALGALRRVMVSARAGEELELIAEVIRCAQTARKHGFVALEAQLELQSDPFFRRGLRLALDGMLPKALIETLEQENATFEEECRKSARVFETAGGFAPTIGIIGAVLGLIHVMENLAEPAKLGAGIAVAFVATIYGVGSANLVLLPVARKLTHRMKRDLRVRELLIEGVVGVQSGVNPHYLEARLLAFVEERDRREGGP